MTHSDTKLSAVRPRLFAHSEPLRDDGSLISDEASPVASLEPLPMIAAVFAIALMAATVGLTMRTKLSLVWLVLGGGVLGAVGLVGGGTGGTEGIEGTGRSPAFGPYRRGPRRGSSGVDVIGRKVSEVLSTFRETNPELVRPSRDREPSSTRRRRGPSAGSAAARGSSPRP